MKFAWIFSDFLGNAGKRSTSRHLYIFRHDYTGESFHFRFNFHWGTPPASADLRPEVRALRPGEKRGERRGVLREHDRTPPINLANMLANLTKGIKNVDSEKRGTIAADLFFELVQLHKLKVPKAGKEYINNNL